MSTAVGLVDAARVGFAEIVDGARHWRVWHLIGSRDLRHPYVRSVEEVAYAYAVRYRRRRDSL
jgi:hypothetical protein